MIKIIKSGKIPSTVVTGTCIRCKALVEWDGELDGTKTFDQREGECVYTIECPTPKCGQPINGYAKGT